MLLWFCGKTKVTKKIYANYLEKENFFRIFVVKLRVLFSFHYYKFPFQPAHLPD